MDLLTFRVITKRFNVVCNVNYSSFLNWDFNIRGMHLNDHNSFIKKGNKWLDFRITLLEGYR